MGLCPNCGYNLALEEPIELGRWQLLPREIRRDGELLKLSPQMAQLLYEVARARPRHISRQTLVGRLCREDRGSVNHISIVKHFATARIGELPIVSSQGLGYRWKDDP